jgi:predicted dehydrogenase
MKPVRFGVIGCGVMGARHAAVAAERDEFELVAVADIKPELVEKVAADTKPKRTYASAEELLADDEIEAVAIALPTGFRTPIALKAFAAGKHAILEKPVAMNVGEVEQMIEAAGDKLVVAVCSSRYWFHDSSQLATKIVADGTLGDLRVVHFRGMLKDGGPKPHPIPAWRVSHKLNGGGFWVNWACYDLGYLMGITGWQLKPKTVLAQTFPVADHLPDRVAEGSDGEEHAIVLIRCENGTILQLERGESLSIDTESTWQIIGAKASLRLNMLELEDNKIFLDRTHPDKALTTEIVWEGKHDHAVTMSGPLLDFASGIRNGTQVAADLERSLVMQKITDAIYKSAAEGCAVEL